jgi:hypothetical protein
MFGKSGAFLEYIRGKCLYTILWMNLFPGVFGATRKSENPLRTTLKNTSTL